MATIKLSQKPTAPGEALTFSKYSNCFAGDKNRFLWGFTWNSMIRGAGLDLFRLDVDIFILICGKGKL